MVFKVSKCTMCYTVVISLISTKSGNSFIFNLFLLRRSENNGGGGEVLCIQYAMLDSGGKWSALTLGFPYKNKK